MDGSGEWGVPVQGRKLPLADLIRFPSESLRYNKDLNEKFGSENPCEKGSRLIFDFEAFQVDRYGELKFTRSFGEMEKISEFCLDSVSLGPQHHFMAAVFCSANDQEVDQSLQKLVLANSAQNGILAQNFAVLIMLCTRALMN